MLRDAPCLLALDDGHQRPGCRERLHVPRVRANLYGLSRRTRAPLPLSIALGWVRLAHQAYRWFMDQVRSSAQGPHDDSCRQSPYDRGWPHCSSMTLNLTAAPVHGAESKGSCQTHCGLVPAGACSPCVSARGRAAGSSPARSFGFTYSPAFRTGITREALAVPRHGGQRPRHSAADRGSSIDGRTPLKEAGRPPFRKNAD